jgi:hypothetical protein
MGSSPGIWGLQVGTYSGGGIQSKICSAAEALPRIVLNPDEKGRGGVRFLVGRVRTDISCPYKTGLLWCVVNACEREISDVPALFLADR